MKRDGECEKIGVYAEGSATTCENPNERCRRFADVIVKLGRALLLASVRAILSLRQRGAVRRHRRIVAGTAFAGVMLFA